MKFYRGKKKLFLENILDIHHDTKKITESKKLEFSEVGDKDVYNLTAPFTCNGNTYLAGRVENRDFPLNAKVMIFSEKNNIWTPIKDSPTLDLEDPFITKIGEEIVLGGVNATFDENHHVLNWVTQFYKGKDVHDLQYFARGPDKMKDIRLVELSDNNVGVFTRPQGKVGGKGRIGFMKLDSLNDLPCANYDESELIFTQMNSRIWMGANEVHNLGDSKLGVIGHIAYEKKNLLSKNTKHYHAVSFVYDHDRKETSDFKVIATRDDFPEGVSKRTPELDDVIFSGGLIRDGSKDATLYVGLSDAECGKTVIKDPFYKE